MRRNDFYEEILEAKNDMFDFLDKFDGDTVEEFVRGFMKFRPRKTVLQQVATIDVLASGTIWCYGTEFSQFSMPATACCMENMRYTLKEYRKRKTHIFLYERIWERYTEKCITL